MRRENMLLFLMLVSVLSSMTQHMVRADQLTEESCTVQILVPGLKGTTDLTNITDNKEKMSQSLLPICLLKETQVKRGKKGHQEDQEELAQPERLV